MNYDCDYFIQKFEAIPEELWCSGEVRREDGRCCAIGHCGEATMGDEIVYKEETRALSKLLSQVGMNHWSFEAMIYKINDGGHAGYRQKTPRARILAALHDIKAKGVV